MSSDCWQTVVFQAKAVRIYPQSDIGHAKKIALLTQLLLHVSSYKQLLPQRQETKNASSEDLCRIHIACVGLP